MEWFEPMRHQLHSSTKQQACTFGRLVFSAAELAEKKKKGPWLTRGFIEYIALITVLFSMKDRLIVPVVVAQLALDLQVYQKLEIHQ